MKQLLDFQQSGNPGISYFQVFVFDTKLLFYIPRNPKLVGMASILAFFAFIAQFFYFLWAAFLRIFVSDVRSNTKLDIEAGIEPAEIEVKTTQTCIFF